MLIRANFALFLAQCDAVAMGRTTFEPAFTADRWPWPGKRIYVLTSRPLETEGLPSPSSRAPARTRSWTRSATRGWPATSTCSAARRRFTGWPWDRFAAEAACHPSASHADRRRHRGHEVRRHLGRRRRAAQARRAADRRQARGRATASSPSSARAARRPTSSSPRPREISPSPDPREMDMLLSTGERSRARCARWRSTTSATARSRSPGSQAGHRHRHVAHEGADPRGARRPHPPRARRGRDRPRRRLPGRLDRADVTTLGRGGSDTTAVALAAAVGAEVCEIYTDVPGVFSRRPADRARRAQAADRLLRGDARDGGLGRRRAAAALASSTRATTACASTAGRASTTRPVPLSCRRRRPWSTLSSPPSRTRPARPASRSWACPTRPASPAASTTALAEANINIDMIIQNEPVSGGARCRHVVHGPARRPAGRARALEPWPPSSASASPPTRRWARSRSSAPA